MPNEYASLLICYSILYLLFTGLQQYLSIVLLISNVIAIKIDLTTNSTITQHIMIVYRFICWYFNSHSHERSDHFQRTLWRLLCHISIHAPTRGATSPGTTPLRWHWFQYTLPREERHITPEQWEQLKNFNTRSHERSDNGWWLSRGAGSNFNPRSHERRDNYIPDEFKSYIISIHAPTRGATMTSDETGMVAIFQSTLPREERHWWMAVWWRIFEFQSTLPREERRDI